MDRIFYKSDTMDAYSGAPIYVFDTSYLPSTDDIDYELFIPTMMLSLPSHPYVVIMFSGGLNKILWIWGIKFLKSFLADDDRNVHNLLKIIAVHESWFVKSITQLLANFAISKPSLSKLNLLFDTKKQGKSLLTSCDDLSELSNYVDISRLKLSLNIYKHDAQVTTSTTIVMASPAKPIISDTTRFCAQSDPIFYHHFYQLFNIVDMYGPKVELLFHKPGNRMNTDILFNCMLRNQVLWINDWDLYCIASCFKKILMEMPAPLVPVDLITLPMRDDLDYLLVIFNHILAFGNETGADVVLFQLMDLCRRIVDNQQTKHSYVSILRSLCHALTNEPISQINKDRISMAVRFVKNLLLNWPQIRPLYLKRFKSVSAIVNGEDLNDATIDELYNMSYDITMEGESDEDGNPHYDVLTSASDLLLELRDDSKDRKDSVSEVSKDFSKLDVAIKLETTPKSKHQWGIPLDFSKNVEQEEVEEDFEEESVRASKEQAIADQESNDIKEMRNIKGVNNEETKVDAPRDRPKVSHSDPPLSREPKIRQSTLNDVSNVQLQWPPQKYKFERSSVPKSIQVAPEMSQLPKLPVKKPVVRGRKVGELARLFEERSQAMDLLRTL